MSQPLGMLAFVRRVLFAVLAFEALLFGYGIYVGGFGYLVTGIAVILAAVTALLLVLTRPSRFR